jgi:hypothetical protein
MTDLYATIERPSGETVVVRTDFNGTTVTDSSGSKIVTYGDDRHWETVDDYTRDGGSIVGSTQSNFASGGEVPFPFSLRLSSSVISSLAATATRTGDAVSVAVSGNLPDSCHVAGIYDWYPGGQIQYIRDPGAAQVFIAVGKPKDEGCLEVLRPWKSSINLYPHSHHKTIQIIVNGDKALEVGIAGG